MLHKNKLEKQITDEVINDLFKIFINSKDEQEFISEINEIGYKEPKKLWSIFYPKYDKYRTENLLKIN